MQNLISFKICKIISYSFLPNKHRNIYQSKPVVKIKFECIKKFNMYVLWRLFSNFLICWRTILHNTKLLFSLYLFFLLKNRLWNVKITYVSWERIWHQHLGALFLMTKNLRNNLKRKTFSTKKPNTEVIFFPFLCPFVKVLSYNLFNHFFLFEFDCWPIKF